MSEDEELIQLILACNQIQHELGGAKLCSPEDARRLVDLLSGPGNWQEGPDEDAEAS